MIRIGIIGAGFIAESHARGFAALPASQARLTAVAGRSYERADGLARRYGAEAVHDFASLLPLVDAVTICTPTPTHAEFAVAALRAGKHVLCEKPIARTTAEAEGMLAAARESTAKLMCAHLTRYEPEHRKAREVLQRGDIGQLRMASHSAVASMPTWASDAWFADLEQSGGPLLDLALHGFDYLLWLFESPVRRVYAAVAGQGAAQYALVSLRFENGGIGQVEASWAHPGAAGFALRVELVGTEGLLNWDYDQVASMQVVRQDTGKSTLLMVGEDSFVSQCEAFVTCIEADTPPPITGQDGLAALRVSLAALESAESGRAVEL
jgi:predicted dehydrogenase